MPEPKHDEHVEWPSSDSDYELIELIGHGASANVWKAKCKTNGELVAVKVIDLESGNSSYLDEIRQEIQTMTMIAPNENLLRFHCVFATDQYLWMVMPLLKASVLDLMQCVKKDGLPEECIGYVLTEVCKALMYFHSAGRIHRDIKASNILLDSDANVLLADFGVSSVMMEGGSRLKKRQTFVGTPCWMAPEVVEQNNKGYDQKADIWSLGITALEMLYGQAPHAELPAMKVLIKTLQREPPAPPEGTSSKMKGIVTSCLKRKPEERPAAADVLAQLAQWGATRSKTRPGPKEGREKLHHMLSGYKEHRRPLAPKPKPTAIKLQTSGWKFSGPGPTSDRERTSDTATSPQDRDKGPCGGREKEESQKARERAERGDGRKGDTPTSTREESRPPTPAEGKREGQGEGTRKGRFTVRRNMGESSTKPAGVRDRPGDKSSREERDTPAPTPAPGLDDRRVSKELAGVAGARDREPSILSDDEGSLRDVRDEPVPMMPRPSVPASAHGTLLSMGAPQALNLPGLMRDQLTAIEMLLRPPALDAKIPDDATPAMLRGIIANLTARNRDLAAKNEALKQQVDVLTAVGARGEGKPGDLIDLTQGR